LARRFGAELFGTFALTLTACAVETVAFAHPELSHAERSVAPALMVLALIYAISDVSGAHINPVVTLCFALRGVFEWTLLPVYWAAQALGALGAAAALRGMLGSVTRAAATLPKIEAVPACAFEALLTLLLVSVILHTSKRHAAVGPQSALAVGATLAACGMWGGPLTGASMNPARSLASAVVTQQLAGCWIYVLGPICGGALAVLLTRLIHGPISPEEIEVAEGNEGHS
jgi:aquaporin Z